MNYLTYMPVYSRLTTAQQEKLLHSSRILNIAAGDSIHDGTGCTGLILVISGQLRASTLSEDGRQITLYRLFERDICLLSASCILNGIQFDVTITAQKPTRVLIIPSQTYKQVMEESALLANYTNEIMASRFSEVMWLMEQVLWKSFDKRLARFLLEEAQIEDTTTLKLTHEAIGAHLGNPREVVSRMLKYFAQEGLIALSRGTIHILDEEALKKTAYS